MSDRQTSKNKELTGHTVVRVDFRVWGQIVEGHYQYPHVISTFCFQRCTVWRVAGNTFFTYAWKGNRTASSDARVGVWVSFCASEWLCGRNQKSTINYYGNPRWQKSLVNLNELTFKGEANPRSRLLHAQASANTEGQKEELGSRCCHGNSHAGSPQRSKSGRKEERRMNYYYRVPHEKWET